MKEVLYNYDIYPKAFLGDCKKTVTIEPLGLHSRFMADHEYTLKITKIDESNPRKYPERSGRTTLTAVPSEDGCLHFEAYFEGEGEHFIDVYANPEDKSSVCRLSVFSLAEDMAGMIPLRGDLHMHTCRSDGRQGPATVAAYYRGYGYDFFAITDHNRYYPSIEVAEAYGDLTDFAMLPGEEVHLPQNDVHYVNFGGSYSINALVTPSKNAEKAGDDLGYRSIDGIAPDPMTSEEFIEMINERAKSVDREHESERKSYAVLEWIYGHMQKNGGLGIFPHPYWYCPAPQLPAEYTEFIYKNAPFDAFEVLGGESYFAHNGYQSILYYEMKAKGYDRAIVGSTDSHGCTEHNANSRICSTIVFATANERLPIIDAVKSKYSVAVDTISREYRLVGELRLVKYASFLMENYFPLHDLACAAEGYYMNRYVAGDRRAAEVLRAMKGQIPEMQKKYFEV